MTRRSTPQKQTDDRHYPVRMMILVPREGFGRLIDPRPGSIYHWLDQEVGRGHYAVHAGGRYPGVEIRDQCAFYFRHPRDALRFLEAFPMLEIADRTEDGAYTSPIGREPRP